MNYCLNSNELERILLFYLEGMPIEDELVNLLFDNAVQWQDKLLSLTFSFARILERQRGSELLSRGMIPVLFSMPEKMFFEIQECDEDFVEYMLRNEHLDVVDLESSLQKVAEKLLEHCYGKSTLCY